MNKEENNAKIHPDEMSGDGENEDDLMEIDGNDLDNTKNDSETALVNSKQKEASNAKGPEGEDDEDGESQNKQIRTNLDKLLNQQSGQFIQKAIGIMSVTMCITFIVLTHKEPWEIHKPCKVYHDEFTILKDKFIEENNEEVYEDLQFGTKMGPHGAETYFILKWRDLILPDTNEPRCDEFYYSRMPLIYEYVDKGVVLILAVYYVLQIFIAQNRWNYFTQIESMMDLTIIVPIFIFGFNCGQLGLFFKAISRLFRLQKIQIFIKSDDSNEDSNVRDQIKKISTELFIMIIISATVFQVIENFVTDPLLNPQYPLFSFNCVYFMFVTLMTVGYGDYYPRSRLGQMFDIFIILYIIVYKLAFSLDELLRLMSLKSFYARTSYKSNNDIPHVVITG